MTLILLTFSAWAQGLKGHGFWYAGDCKYQEMVFLSRWACSPQTSGREAEPLCSPSSAGHTGSVPQRHVGPQHWITIGSWVPSTYCLLAWCSRLCKRGRWKAYIHGQHDKHRVTETRGTYETILCYYTDNIKTNQEICSFCVLRFE